MELEWGLLKNATHKGSKLPSINTYTKTCLIMGFLDFSGFVLDFSRNPVLFLIPNGNELLPRGLTKWAPWVILESAVNKTKESTQWAQGDCKDTSDGNGRWKASQPGMRALTPSPAPWRPFLNVPCPSGTPPCTLFFLAVALSLCQPLSLSLSFSTILSSPCPEAQTGHGPRSYNWLVQVMYLKVLCQTCILAQFSSPQHPFSIQQVFIEYLLSPEVIPPRSFKFRAWNIICILVSPKFIPLVLSPPLKPQLTHPTPLSISTQVPREPLQGFTSKAPWSLDFSSTASPAQVSGNGISVHPVAHVSFLSLPQLNASGNWSALQIDPKSSQLFPSPTPSPNASSFSFRPLQSPTQLPCLNLALHPG